MNTIIPNELGFDSDIRDLPHRAEQVSLGKLNLSGGFIGKRQCRVLELRANGGKGARTRKTSQFGKRQAELACARSCKGYTGSQANEVGLTSKKYWNCYCCDEPNRYR